MTDYTERINALREHADLIETSIELYGPSATRLLVYDLRNAAAAIEDMAKHITEMHERVTVLQIARGELEAEVKRLKDSNEELREKQTFIDHYGTEWMTSAKDVPTAAYEHGYADGRAEVKAQLPKLGEWIDRYDEDDKPFFKRKYVCSACGHWNTYGKSNYCPKCGAKMREVQE